MGELERIGGRGIRIPAHLQHKVKQARSEATSWCAICGEVPPQPVLGGGYYPLPCACELRLSRAATDRREAARQTFEDSERRKAEAASHHCYTWLGLRYTIHGLADYDLADFRMESPTLRDAVNKLREFIFRPSPVLILSGPVGVGKTRLICSALNWFRKTQFKTGLFTTAPNLFDVIDERRMSDEPYQDIKAQLANTDICVIDDIDKLAPTEARQTFWFDLIDKRVNLAATRRPGEVMTFLTTNVEMRQSAKPLTRWVGEAAASRLNEGLTLVYVEGSDYREKLIVRSEGVEG